MVPIQVALRNSRGQGLIESLVMSAALLAAVNLILAMMYFGFLHIGVNYLLHELLVCRSTQGESQCEVRFRQRAQSFLFAGKILTLECQHGFYGERIRLVLALPLGKTLTIKKELRLP